MCAEVDMQIVLNGNSVETTHGCSIAELLQHLGISSERVAVEMNEVIVPKSGYEIQLLSDGDRIEIVHFVGGG